MTQNTRQRSLSALDIAVALGLPAPTAAQQAVIEAPLEPSIVVAGAGSGKTETMANRVVWLLASGKVGVSEVLGLTFTRKAAGELSARIRQRIEALASADVGFEFDPFDAPTIATYNSFASTIFRENALLIGREPESVILSEASAWQLARKLVVSSTDTRLIDLEKSVDAITTVVIALSRSLSENVADSTAVHAMSEAFARLQELPVGSGRRTDMYARVRDATGIVAALPPILELADLFQAEKRRRGFVEFSDQVALALAITEQLPIVVSDLRSRFRVVLLDEYQDTSVVQTQLLSGLFANHPVMAVGDPHQSIYGWRGASAANLARFSRDFTGADTSAHEFALSTSWRNPLTVLDAANTIVQPLSDASPIHVEALSARPDVHGGSVDVVFEQTIVEEADSVARWFSDQLGRTASDGSPRSAAMLCRSVKKIDVFTAALREHNIRYHVLGLGGLLEQPVIADLVSALRVMHDPTAGSALIRLLVGARWMIAPRDIKALRKLASWLSTRDHRYQPLSDDVRARMRASVADDEGASLVDAIDFLVEAPESHSALADFSSAGLERMRQAGQQLAYLRSRAGLDLLDLSTLVQQELRLDVEITANETATLGRSSLDAFDEQIASYLGSDESATLGSFLSWLAEAERRDNLSPRTEEPERGVVQIMTIHGSKGLERDIVAVPRMVDGELPGPPKSKRGWLEFGALPSNSGGTGRSFRCSTGAPLTRRKNSTRPSKNSRLPYGRGTMTSKGALPTSRSPGQSPTCCSAARGGRLRKPRVAREIFYWNCSRPELSRPMRSPNARNQSITQSESWRPGFRGRSTRSETGGVVSWQQPTPFGRRQPPNPRASTSEIWIYFSPNGPVGQFMPVRWRCRPEFPRHGSRTTSTTPAALPPSFDDRCRNARSGKPGWERCSTAG